MNPPIDLQLTHPNDTPLQTSINSILTSLINTPDTPTTAATEIDSIFTITAHQSLQSYTTTPHPSTAPQPRSDQNNLWDSISRAATRIPPSHPGQDKLVSLISALTKLPKKTVKAYSPDDYLYDFTLWELNRGNGYGGLEQILWDLQRSGVRGREEEDVNFAAFCARLLREGVVETSRLCGLRWLKRPNGDIGREREVEVLVGGMWLVYAGDVLFECSRVDALTSVGEWKVTGVLWKRWREYYGIIAGEDQFEEEVRVVARRVVSRMDEVEREGVTTNAIEIFGFDPQRDEDDEDEDE